MHICCFRKGVGLGVVIDVGDGSRSRCITVTHVPRSQGPLFVSLIKAQSEWAVMPTSQQSGACTRRWCCPPYPRTAARAAIWLPRRPGGGRRLRRPVAIRLLGISWSDRKTDDAVHAQVSSFLCGQGYLAATVKMRKMARFGHATRNHHNSQTPTLSSWVAQIFAINFFLNNHVPFQYCRVLNAHIITQVTGKA